LLTKGIPIEGTAILAREFPARLADVLSEVELRQAQDYLYQPGISVLRDAQIATQAGRVTAMHDPTEGGLAGALWELAEACGHRLQVDTTAVPIPHLAQKVCATFDLNPLATIASGALLLTAVAGDVPAIVAALQDEGIGCAEIGVVVEGKTAVYDQSNQLLPRPSRDEITRVFE
jgi:hydrogenase maturation factor